MRRLPPPPTQPDPEEDTPQVLDSTHVALRTMFADEKISDDTYYKNVIGLAMRWIALGRVEDAVGLVTELSPDYVRHTLPDQMSQDPVFRQVAIGVARRLAQNPLEMDDDDVELALMLLERPKAKA